MSFEAIAEAQSPSEKFPFLQKGIGHGIVVDGKKEIGGRTVGAGHPLHQAAVGAPPGDQQKRPVESSLGELPHNELCEPQIEFIFVHAAGPYCPGHFFRVADVDHEAKSAAIAGIHGGLAGRRSRWGLAGRRSRWGLAGRRSHWDLASRRSRGLAGRRSHQGLADRRSRFCSQRMKRAKEKQQREYQTRHGGGPPFVQVSHVGLVLEKPGSIRRPICPANSA